MANKPLHEYNPFRGNEGFLIVDGLDNTASGGILKFPNYAGKTDGAVLTKKTVNDADEIVWEVPQGGGGLPDAESLIGKVSTIDGNVLELRVVCDITRDSTDHITGASDIRWQYNSNGSGSWSNI
jgi:hypothetical protein